MERPKLVRLATIPDHLWCFADGQASFLRERGFEVHGASSPDEELAAFGEREQVPVHAVRMSRRISPAADLGALMRLVGLFRRLRPHIVHGSTPKAGLLSMLAARMTGVPVRVYHVAGLRWSTLDGLSRWLVRNSERTSCNLAHLVVCASESVREVLIAGGMCGPEKAVVLGRGHTNGIDTETRFNPELVGAETGRRVRAEQGIPQDALVAGFVGRLVRDKGVEELAGAWAALREELPDLHLLLVGRWDPIDPPSPEVARALKDDPRVHLTGWTTDVAPKYAAMDLCVISSYREGLPTVALEAGAMRLPVVCTDAIGCVNAVEPGVTGTQVPVGSAAALAAAMRAYALDPELRARHGAAAREWVREHFRNEIVWEHIYGHYVRLLRERGLPLPAWELRAPESAEPVPGQAAAVST